jgi:hypothetical protein
MEGGVKMSDVKISPTPIQRNANDVAIELVNLHASRFSIQESDIPELFTKYVALARYLNSKNYNDLKQFLPEEIRNKF